jgi:hypothetical protein
MFWTYKDAESGQTMINSVGFRSQHCFIDPARENVIVKFSSNPDLTQIANDIGAIKSLTRVLSKS